MHKLRTKTNKKKNNNFLTNQFDNRLDILFYLWQLKVRDFQILFINHSYFFFLSTFGLEGENLIGLSYIISLFRIMKFRSLKKFLHPLGYLCR